MGIFKKNITLQYVRKLHQKRFYSKLIKLLGHEDPSIVERAEMALCELATDEDEKQERSMWSKDLNYDPVLEQLESPKYSEHQEAIYPLIKALRQEMQVKFKLRYYLEELGISGFPEKFIEDLEKHLDSDEKIEYVGGGGEGEAWGSKQGIFVTNKGIIHYNYGGHGFNKFVPIKYDSITEVKRGSENIKIIAGEGYVRFSITEKELISHIARHVPKLKDSL